MYNNSAPRTRSAHRRGIGHSKTNHNHQASVNLRVGDRRRAFEEIEVAAAIGLRDVLGIQPAEAARVRHLARLPGGAPARQLLVGDAQRQTPCRARRAR